MLEELIAEHLKDLPPEETHEAMQAIFTEIKIFDDSNKASIIKDVKKSLRACGHCPECGQALDSKVSYQSVPYSDGITDVEEWTAYCVSCGWEE